MAGFTKFALPLLSLAACASGAMTPYQAYKAGNPLPMYYKAGVSFAQIANDNTNCQIEAAQRVPAQMQVYQTPTYTTPVMSTCNSYGSGFGYGYGYSGSAQTFCSQSGGQTYGGQIQSYDANAALRGKAGAQCMAAKGYRYVNIPPCPAGVDISDQDHEPVLRPLVATTCYQMEENRPGFSVGNY